MLKRKQTSIVLIGNVVEHYDKAIYSLSAPFIAPLFFPTFDPITALLLAYLPFGVFSRLLGAFFFGWLGDKFDHSKAFNVSLIGISLSILFIGLIPTYSEIGPYAPIALHVLRGLIPFFAAGESTAAPLILIERSQKSRNIVSSFYEMSSIIGSALAASLVTLFSIFNLMTSNWRLLFLVSGVLGLLGHFSRKNYLSSVPKTSANLEPFTQTLSKQLPSFFSIIFVTGFSCVNYNLVMHMMNGYLPLVSSITQTQMSALHLLFLCLDFLMLPLFAKLADKVGKEKVMICALLLTLLLTFPVYSLLTEPSLLKILIVRGVFITLGIAFSAPFQNWIISITSQSHRFKTLSISRAIGSKWIGGASISFSFWLYQKILWKPCPSIVVFIAALFALFFMILIESSKKTLVAKTEFNLSKSSL